MHYFICKFKQCRLVLFRSKTLLCISLLCLTEHWTTESTAYGQAAQILDSVVTLILNWEVNVECIDTITRNRHNFEKLVRCYYGQPNAKAGVDCDDVLQRTKKLASEIVQFEDTRLKLQFLCERCSLILPASGRGRG